ncbi:MAG: diacylglycerol kinase family protein [Chloroflexi bacterium]|nr:diacylglycerol kinase family protein [Chloroflexota bacterium]
MRTLRSFGYAWEGIGYLARTQPNFRVHLTAMAAVLAVAVGVGVTAAEFGVLVLAIGLVMVGEAVNTAIEAVVDLTTPVVHPLAKVAKDVAAGGVLLAAMAAATTGAVILGPRVYAVIAP